LISLRKHPRRQSSSNINNIQTEWLINSDSTVTKLWNPTTLGNPEDGGHMFPKTLIQTRATRYKVPEGIYNKVKCCLIFYCWLKIIEQRNLSSGSSWKITDISHLTPQCDYHYFSEDTTHVVLFRDMVSIKH
jgi:hypothetical protein